MKTHIVKPKVHAGMSLCFISYTGRWCDFARILRTMLLVCASIDGMIVPPFNSMVENVFFSLKEKVSTLSKLFLCASRECVLGRRWFHVERTVQTHNIPRFLIFEQWLHDLLWQTKETTTRSGRWWIIRCRGNDSSQSSTMACHHKESEIKETGWQLHLGTAKVSFLNDTNNF